MSEPGHHFCLVCRCIKNTSTLWKNQSCATGPSLEWGMKLDPAKPSNSLPPSPGKGCRDPAGQVPNPPQCYQAPLKNISWGIPCTKMCHSTPKAELTNHPWWNNRSWRLWKKNLSNGNIISFKPGPNFLRVCCPLSTPAFSCCPVQESQTFHWNNLHTWAISPPTCHTCHTGESSWEHRAHRCQSLLLWPGPGEEKQRGQNVSDVCWQPLSIHTHPQQQPWQQGLLAEGKLNENGENGASWENWHQRIFALFVFCSSIRSQAELSQ